MTYKHKHHIIPKHMGGSDDKSNLIELTPKQHALAHKKLYEQYGKWQDLFAYKALSGRMKKEDIHREKARMANLGNKHFLGKTHTSETRKKISEGNMVAKLGNTYRLGKPHTERTKEKISDTLKGNSNKLGKTGYKLSEETKNKMSLAKTGKNNPATRPDVREKLRQSALRRYRMA